MAEPVVLRFDVQDPGTPKLRALDSRISMLETRLRQLEGTGGKTGQALQRLSSGPVSRFGASLRSIEGVAAAVTTGLAAMGLTVGGLAVLRRAGRDAIDFSRALAEVSTLVDETDAALRRLGGDIRATSVQFGQNPVAQARAVYQGISAGAIDAGNSVAFLNDVNTLALAGVTDVATAMEGLIAVMKPYQIEADRAAEISDKLFLTVKRGITTVPELANSLGQVTPIAAQVGLSLEELLGAVSAITAATKLSTSETATQISSLLRALLRAGERSGQIAQETGIAFDEIFSVRNFREKGLVAFLAELDEALRATGAREEVLFKLTGRAEALSAVLTLTGAASQDLARNIDELAQAEGTAAEAAGKVANTFAQQSAVLGAAFQELRISIGEILGEAFVDAAPLLVAGLESATTAARAFADILPLLEGAALGAAAAIFFKTQQWFVLSDAVTGANLASNIAERSLLRLSGTAAKTGAAASQAGRSFLSLAQVERTAANTFDRLAESAGRQSFRLAQAAEAERALARAAVRASAQRFQAAERIGRGFALTDDAARRLAVSVATGDDVVVRSIANSSRAARALQSQATNAALTAERYQLLSRAVRVAATAGAGLLAGLDVLNLAIPITQKALEVAARSSDELAQKSADAAQQSAGQRLVFTALRGDAEQLRAAFRGVGEAQDLAFRPEKVARFFNVIAESGIPVVSFLAELFFSIGGLGDNELSGPAKQLAVASREALPFVRQLANAQDDLTKASAAISIGGIFGKVSEERERLVQDTLGTLRDVQNAPSGIAEDEALEQLQGQLRQLESIAKAFPDDLIDKAVRDQIGDVAAAVRAAATDFDLLGAAARNAARQAEAEAEAFERAISAAQTVQRSEDSATAARLARLKAGQQLALLQVEELDRAELSARFAREELALKEEALNFDLRNTQNRARQAEDSEARANALKDFAKIESEINLLAVLRADQEAAISKELERHVRARENELNLERLSANLAQREAALLNAGAAQSEIALNRLRGERDIALEKARQLRETLDLVESERERAIIGEQINKIGAEQSANFKKGADEVKRLRAQEGVLHDLAVERIGLEGQLASVRRLAGIEELTTREEVAAAVEKEFALRRGIIANIIKAKEVEAAVAKTKQEQAVKEAEIKVLKQEQIDLGKQQVEVTRQNLAQLRTVESSIRAGIAEGVGIDLDKDGFQNQLDTIQEATSAATQAISQSFSDAFQSVIDGTKTVEQAWEDFLLNLVSRLNEILLDAALQLAVDSLFSSILQTGQAGGTTDAASLVAGAQAASGGTEQVAALTARAEEAAAVSEEFATVSGAASDAADVSRAAAAVSETTTATSEIAAATSQTGAVAAEGGAITAETAAATSASAAATSASAAATSAGAAATSAGAAATSAATAVTSATTATASASTSVSAAVTSVTAATTASTAAAVATAAAATAVAAAAQATTAAVVAAVVHEGGLIARRFHFGGLSPDEVPAILQTGEFVVSRRGVDAVGEDALQAINSGNDIIGSGGRHDASTGFGGASGGGQRFGLTPEDIRRVMRQGQPPIPSAPATGEESFGDSGPSGRPGRHGEDGGGGGVWRVAMVSDSDAAEIVRSPQAQREIRRLIREER